MLILLPTEKNKLLMQWKGPFTVKEKIGPTDYRIQVGNKTKIFHINMLKRYIERPEIKLGITAAILDYEDSEYLEVDPLLDKRQETFRNVYVASQLSTKQRYEAQQILGEFSKIVSDIPGFVKYTQHTISLKTNKPIKVKPYPIPFTKIEAAEKEVSKMLEMDIIKPSNSSYSAPLLCIDFRQLNKAPKFDSEPIPNPEDIYVKLN